MIDGFWYVRVIKEQYLEMPVLHKDINKHEKQKEVKEWL